MVKRRLAAAAAICMLLICSAAYGEYPVDISGLGAAALSECGSGTAVISCNSEEKLEVGGLGRLPLLLAACERIDGGGLALTDTVTISREAAAASGPTAFLEANERVEVSMLLKAAAVICAGDAICALAEGTYGSLEACAVAAHQRLDELGVTAAEGDIAGGNIRLSADELTAIGRALMRSECFLLYSGIFYDEIRHEDGRTTELASSNRLIKSCAGTNGIATGSSASAGYCGVFSVKRGETAYVCAVIGAKSSAERAEKAKAMLEYAFGAYEVITAASAGECIATVGVKNGTQTAVELTASDDAVCLLPKGAELEVKSDIPEVLEAPIFAGERLGSVSYGYNGEEIARVELTSACKIPKAGTAHYCGQIMLEWLHA